MKEKETRRAKPNKRRTLAKQIREDFKRVETLYARRRFDALSRFLESRATTIFTGDYRPYGKGRLGLLWKRTAARGVKRVKLKLISATMSEALGVCGRGRNALDTIACIAYEIGLYSSPVEETLVGCSFLLHKQPCPWD